MPKVVFEEIEARQITKAEAMAWIEAQAGIDLRIAGGLLKKDFSYNDLDLTLHTHPCREIVKTLPSANFRIQIYCRICGATMNYNPNTDIWTWRFSKAIAERTLDFPLDKTALSAKEFHELKDKVDKISDKK